MGPLIQRNWENGPYDQSYCSTYARFGLHQAPGECFLFNLGLETLHLRMAQHCKNAWKGLNPEGQMTK